MLTYPNLVYTSGDYSVAEAVSLPVFTAPLQGVNENLFLRQSFMQNLLDRVPMPLNTAHPDYAEYVLAEESEQSDVSGGKVRWTRTYARKPSSNYSEGIGSYRFTFPAFYANILDTGAGGNDAMRFVYLSGRPFKEETVPAFLQRDFFLVGTGGDYATVEDIPVITAFNPFYGPDEIPTQNVLWNTGDAAVPVTITDSTVPSRTDYLAMIAAETMIPVEGSRLTRWIGNFWIRETIYVKSV